MQESKWSFLKPWALSAIESNPDLPIKTLAAIALDTFKLDLDIEQMRKVLSRLINEDNSVESEKSSANYVSVASDKLHEQEFIITTASTGTGFENMEHNFWYGRAKKDTKPQPVLHLKHNKPGTYIVLGCWHAPFHNVGLTNGVANLIEDIKPQGLILNGDFLDCNSLSSHDRGRFTAIPGLSLKKEYELGSDVLDQLTEHLPKDALKVYMYGNHEDRYFRYIADMQNAKTPPQSPTEGMHLFERGFQVIESYSTGYMTLGQHLDILHGIYYNTHCAKTHIDRFRGSVLFAHTHRIQSYIEGRTGGFNIGWGGDATAKAFGYADRGTKASWQNGFAIVNIDETGDYYVNQVIANNGNFYYNGNKY